MRQRPEIAAILNHYRECRKLHQLGISEPVRRVLQCLHDQVFDPAVSVQSLRKRCRIADHNISMRFKQEVGISMKRYLEVLRLDAAHELLRRDGELTIADVATAVGYTHLQTFYRAFTRRFAMAPGKIRLQSRAVEDERRVARC